ncbi:MAG: hypothetical protein ACOX6D_05125 [Thermoguttaceae bacterium]|jgi:hypothetical protein
MEILKNSPALEGAERVPCAELPIFPAGVLRILSHTAALRWMMETESRKTHPVNAGLYPNLKIKTD